MSEERITLQIEKLAQGGEGFGRYQGRVIFVPYAIPGEKVAVTITHESKDYAKGEIAEILAPAPERRTPLCPVFTRCGGCQLQNLPEPAQVRYKSEALRDALARIGRLTRFDLLPAVASPHPFYYRTRVRLKAEGGTIGFYQSKSHNIVEIDACPLLIPSLNRIIPFIKKEVPLPNLEEIEMQGADPGDEFLLILRGEKFHLKELEALYAKMGGLFPLRGLIAYTKRGRRVIGRDYLFHTLGDKTVRISDQSFSQVNPEVNRALIRTVFEWAAPAAGDRILELYSGIGNFTLFLSQWAGAVAAVEENPIAVEDARWNLKNAGIRNVLLHCGSAESWFKKEGRERRVYNKVFLDPPREGAAEKTLIGIVRLAPEKIFYLSCEPATLARDLRRLSAHGYSLKRIQPFDMFPQTGRLELLAEVAPDPPTPSR